MEPKDLTDEEQRVAQRFRVICFKKIINVQAKQQEEREPVSDNNTEVILPYSSYASLTYDDLEYLCGAVAYSFDLHKSKVPSPRSKSALVHQQELSAFRDGYTIREVRDLGLRIKMTTKSKQEKCSFQTVIKRLMQAIVWYGRVDERKILRQSGAR